MRSGCNTGFSKNSQSRNEAVLVDAQVYIVKFPSPVRNYRCSTVSLVTKHQLGRLLSLSPRSSLISSWWDRLIRHTAETTGKLMPDRSSRSHMIWQPGDAVVARARAFAQVAQRNAAFLVKRNTGLHVRQQLICFLCVLHLCRCDISQMCEWHTASSLELLQYQHHQCYWPEYGWKGEYDWAERLFNWISTPIIYFLDVLGFPLAPVFLGETHNKTCLAAEGIWHPGSFNATSLCIGQLPNTPTQHKSEAEEPSYAPGHEALQRGQIVW